MRYPLIVLAFAFWMLADDARAQTLPRQWNFDRSGEQEGWTVPEPLRGAVLGGSLWLTFSPKETDPREMSGTPFEVFGVSIAELRRQQGQKEGPSIPFMASSPGRLGVTMSEGLQVKLRVLNLSPLTDFYLLWRSPDRSFDG